MNEPIRERLPDTRIALTHKFDIAGTKGYITVGRNADGKPLEIFVTLNKPGGTVSGLLRALCLSVSIGLQYGVPLEKLVEKFTGQRFEPSGQSSHPQIGHATSIVDYIFRWLGLTFHHEIIKSK